MISILRNWWFFRRTIRHLEHWTLNGIKIETRQMSAEMKTILVTGRYEAAEVAACSKVIRAGDRVIELGGAIGYVGIHCLKNCHAASVISVEANPNTVSQLRQNYVLNGLNADVIEAAVSNKEGPVEFCIGSEFWEDSIYEGSVSKKKISVPGVTFEHLWSKIDATANVLIADIEGAESTIDWGTLPRAIQRIVVELHPDVYGSRQAYDMLNVMINSGFYVRYASGNVFALERE